MKVLISTSVGGGVFGSSLRDALAAAGWEAELSFSLPVEEYWRRKDQGGGWGLRARMYVWFPLRECFRLLILSRRVIIATTNPFFLPWLLSFVGRLRGHRVILWLYDLYPDALVVGGALRSGSVGERLLGFITRQALRRCDAVVYLGERLQRHTEARYGPARTSRVIPVGSSAAGLSQPPAPSIDGRGLTILYSGHMGRMHDARTLVEALRLGEPGPAGAATEAELRLILNANGPAMGQLRKELPDWGASGEARSLCLPGGNRIRLRLVFGSTMDELRWQQELARAEVSLVTMVRGAESVVMPSKTYSAMLFGQAILAVCPRDSDLAETVLANRAGWVVEPEGTPAQRGRARCDRVFTGAPGLLQAFERLIAQSDEVVQARRNAWEAARARFSAEPVARQWSELLGGMRNGAHQG